MARESYLVHRTSIIGRPAVAYYKLQCKDLKKTDLWRMENVYKFGKIIKSFWKEVGNELVENPNGVFIETFGYFCLTISPKKQVFINRMTNKTYLDSHTNSRQYYITFINLCKNPIQKMFVMDAAFRVGVKERIVKKIKSGVKYKNHIGLLLDMFNTRKKVR